MTPEEHAERALLGAILINPQMIHEVQLTGIMPEDFAAIEHQVLYHAMQETAQQDRFRSFDTLDDVQRFRAALIPHVLEAGRDRKWLRELGISTPRPDQAMRYAVIVLEGHNRRAIIEHARRTAAALATSTPDWLDRTQQQITTLRNVLVGLDTRWQQNGMTTRPADNSLFAEAAGATTEPQQMEAREEAAQTRTRLRDRLPAWMSPEQRRTRRREEQLLASLVRDPSQVAEVAWLRQEDFTTPQAAALFDALSVLDVRGEPIDAISVLAEACRHAPIDEATADRFVAVCRNEGRQAPASAVVLAREVIEQAIATTVNIHVEELIEEVSRGTAGSAVIAARQTLTKIEATVDRFEQSRRLVPGDVQAYVPPDPALSPPAAPQRAASARS